MGGLASNSTRSPEPEGVHGNNVTQVLKIEELVPFPVRDVVCLDRGLIRFRLAGYREAGIPPGDEAVGKSLRHDRALMRMLGQPYGSDGAIRSAADMRSLHVDHFCKPECLYTNGVQIVSLVRREAGRIEIAWHEAANFVNFNWADPDCLLGPDCICDAPDWADAEAEVFRQFGLSRTVLRMRRGTEMDVASLGVVAERRGDQGYTVEVFEGEFLGSTLHLEIGGPCCTLTEAYQVLNTLKPQEFHVEACATCSNFHFSGMMRDMSAGARGYCFHPEAAQKPGTPRPVVSVFGYCREHNYLPIRRYPLSS
jgi:hypothetical protein